MKKIFTEFNLRRNEHDRHRLCHAPFNNLFFSNRGLVMACCSNKMHVLGKYPDMSIREIWEGEKAKEIRKAIIAGDFTRGCQACYTLIENGNYESIPLRVYDNYSYAHPEYPKRMEFELNNTCNLECIMCTGEYSSSIRARREKKEPIPNFYGKDFVGQLEEFIPYLESAQFIGGEPFLIESYVEIWERMIRINPHIQISVTTNGTILNTAVKKILEPMSFSISVSVDSLNPEVYPTIRVNGDLERMLNNVDYFSEYCQRKGTRFSISFCPMRMNWQEIPSLISFCNRKNATVFFNAVYYPPEYSLMNLGAEELIHIHNTLQKFTPPESTALQKINAERFNDLVTEIHSYYKKASTTMQKNHGSVKTWEELLSRINRYIDSLQDISDSVKEEKKNIIRLRISAIKDFSMEEGLGQKALEGLGQLSNDAIYQFVPGAADIERAYGLFKERVLKRS